MTATQNDSGRGSQRGLHLWVSLLLALLLLISWFMGYGPGGSKCAPVAQANVGAAAALQSSASPAGPAGSVARVASAPAEPASAGAVPAAAAPAALPVPTASAATEPASTPAAPATAAMAPAPTPESPPAPEPAGTTPTPKPESSPSAAAVGSVVPVAKVYFAVEKASLPKSASRDLARIVKYLKANPRAKALVSGFHDPSGNRANNENLALRRAQAVATAMQKMGIAKQRILLQKPEQTVGSGKSAEARRVEVGVVRS